MKTLKIFIVLFAALLCASVLWQKSLRIPYFADEYDYVSRGIFLDMIWQGDFTNSRFRSYDSYVQEKLPSYFYRIILYIFRTPPPAILPLTSSWGNDSWCQRKEYTDENCMTFADNWMWTDPHFLEGNSLPNLPLYAQEKLLPVARARIGAWIVTCAAAGIFFMLLFHTWGFSAALAGIFLLTFQPVFDDSMLKAMGDGLFVLFLLGALYCAVWWFLAVQKNNTKTATGAVVALGVCTGLSMSSKFIGLMGIFYMYGLLSQSPVRIKRRSLIIMGVLFCISAGIFFILHPFIWSDPVGSSMFVIKHRATETVSYMSYYSQFVIPTARARVYVLFSQIAHSGMSALFPSLLGLLLDIGLFGTGIAVLVRRASGKNNIRRIWARFFLYWVVSTFIIMVGYVGLRWTRYYMPFILCIAAVGAVGGGALLNAAAEQLFRILNYFLKHRINRVR